ncbi:MAG: hypothetical protein EB110_10425 [Betaproteobacteria bacterium]|nr:hypothetical protein [Betaproteobacteria bacterium]
MGQAVVKVPSGECGQEGMVFQLPLVQLSQADDQTPPFVGIFFDGFQWFPLCLLKMNLYGLKKILYRYIINYI